MPSPGEIFQFGKDDGKKLNLGPEYYDHLFDYQYKDTLGFTIMSRKVRDADAKNRTPAKGQELDEYIGNIKLPKVAKIFCHVKESLTGNNEKSAFMRKRYWPILIATVNPDEFERPIPDKDDVSIKDFFAKGFPAIRMRQMERPQIHAFTERQDPSSWKPAQRTVIDFNLDLCRAFEFSTDRDSMMRLQLLLLAVTYHELAHAYRGYIKNHVTPVRFSTAFFTYDRSEVKDAERTTAKWTRGESGYVIECHIFHGCIKPHFGRNKDGEIKQDDYTSIASLSLTMRVDKAKYRADRKHWVPLDQPLIERLAKKFTTDWEAVEVEDLENPFGSNPPVSVSYLYPGETEPRQCYGCDDEDAEIDTSKYRTRRAAQEPQTQRFGDSDLESEEDGPEPTVHSLKWPAPKTVDAAENN